MEEYACFTLCSGGVLTLFLIKIINPKIDILIAKIKDKISIKKLKLIILIVIIFLAIDCIATCYAQKTIC